MHDQKPHPITNAEWKEIAALRPVREAWGLGEGVMPTDFASVVYGAKFNFVSGGPGYVGDIFILQGDALAEVPPMVLRRDREGHLIVC